MISVGGFSLKLVKVFHRFRLYSRTSFLSGIEHEALPKCMPTVLT